MARPNQAARESEVARAGAASYLPAARRCQRVRFNIFLCFFLRMRFRRFLIRDPMACLRLADRLGGLVRTVSRTDFLGRPCAEWSWL